MQLGHQIASMIDQLTDKEQEIIYELVMRLMPDDVATPEDLVDIAVAKEEFRKGETVKDCDIDWS